MALLFSRNFRPEAQSFGISWSINSISEDYVFYIESLGIVSETIEGLFKLYSDKEQSANKNILALISQGSDGLDTFNNSSKDSPVTDEFEYEYEDPELPGIKFTGKEGYLILPLELYNKLPAKGDIKSIQSTTQNISSGYSDYYFTRYFMPKWSTAYKYNQSTHSKLVEPILSSLTYIPTHIKGLISNTNLINKFNVSDNMPLDLPIYLEQTSKKYKSYFDLNSLVDINYKVGESTIVDFGDYDTIYVQTTKLLPEMELVISGIYKNTFVDCKIKLKSKGYVKLPVKFSKIVSIEKTSYNLDFFEGIDEIFLNISNALPIKGFLKEGRGTRDVEYLEDINRLVLYNSDTSIESVFALDKKYENIYLKTDGKLICTDKSGTVYSGKLDANISMKVPQDVSSNNNVFIETCNRDIVNYRIDLYIKQYVITTSTQYICISVTDSKGEVLYLDKQLNLVTSDEKIFLKLSEIFQDTVTINIEMEPDLEFITIRLEDWDNLYPMVNTIVQPIVKMTPVVKLPVNSSEPLVIIDDKVSYKHISDNSYNHLSILE